jgi:hypothetical protein
MLWKKFVVVENATAGDGLLELLNCASASVVGNATAETALLSRKVGAVSVENEKVTWSMRVRFPTAQDNRNVIRKETSAKIRRKL